MARSEIVALSRVRQALVKAHFKLDFLIYKLFCLCTPLPYGANLYKTTYGTSI